MTSEHDLYPDDLEQAIPAIAKELSELDTITEVAEQLHRLRANGYTPGRVLGDLGIHRPNASWPQAAYELAKWASRYR